MIASREAVKYSFFSQIYMLSLYRNIREEMRKNENVRNSYTVGIYKLTRAVDRKQNYF